MTATQHRFIAQTRLALVMAVLSMVFASCVAVPAGAPAPSFEAYNPARFGRVVALEAIVRQSPDISSPEIIRLPADAVVSVLGRQGLWVQIAGRDQDFGTGWMVADLLEVTSQEPTATASAVALASTEPSTEPTVPAPDPLTPTPLPPTDTPGPAAGPATPTPTPPPVPICFGTVRVRNTHLRAGPGTVYGQVVLVARGDSFQALGQAYDYQWLSVEMEEGQEGWLAGAFVTLGPEPGCEQLPELPIPPTPVPTRPPTREPTPQQGVEDIQPPITVTPTPTSAPATPTLPPTPTTGPM